MAVEKSRTDVCKKIRILFFWGMNAAPEYMNDKNSIYLLSRVFCARPFHSIDWQGTVALRHSINNLIKRWLPEPAMNLILPCTLFMTVGCILMAGCISQKMDDTSKNISLSQTFTSFTVVGTEGPLTISLEGSRTPEDTFTDEYPVYIDNLVAGVVSSKRPVTLAKIVGNYTVKVCCGTLCEQENVTIRFGKQRNVDFSERLQKDLGSSKPAVRIVEYYPNDDQISMNVEFINPTTHPLTMSAGISCGYTYIEAGSYNRVGSTTQGHLSETVNACDRVTKALNFKSARGSSYLYDIPAITLVSSR